MQRIKQETVILFLTGVLCGLICALAIHMLTIVPKVVERPKSFVCEVKVKDKYMLTVYMVFRDCKIITEGKI